MKKKTLQKYSDFTKSNSDLSDDEIKKIIWTKYKIVVPTEKDRQDLMEAFRHIHYSQVNSDFVTVNQLIHEYLDTDDGYTNNIIVDEKLYKEMTDDKK